MKRRFQKTAVAVASLFGLLLSTPTSLAQPLIVVGDDNYPPYLFKATDGNVTGYVADLWKLWEEVTGENIELISTSWAEAQRKMANGEADVIEMIFRTPEREPLYSFSAPYATVETRIYTIDGMPPISTPGQLAGFVVGVQEGDACVSRLKALGVNDLRLYENYQQLIGDMLARNVRIMCMDAQPANYYLDRLDGMKEIERAFTFYVDHFRRAVKKGDTDTLLRIDQGMNSIPEEKLAAIRKKWLKAPIETSSYFYVLLASVIIGLILTAWIGLLRLAVRRQTRELREQAGLLQAERDRLQEIIVATRTATWEWNVQTGECQFNDQWASMLGYRLDELLPTSIETFREHTHPDDLPSVMAALESHIRGETDHYEIDFRMIHKGGNWVWVADRGKLVARTQEGFPLIMRGTHIDITESKHADEIIQWQANYDSLTQLPNRRLFQERLHSAIDAARASGERVALLSIDIDEFKEVNDAFGHHTGDELIVAVGDAIQRSVRETDTVARFSGDEFSVILVDKTNHAQINSVCKRIQAEVTGPKMIGDEQVHVQVSIGVSIFPDDASNADEMLRHSDMAMYASKRNGGNRISLFDQTLQDALNHRTQTTRDLRQALRLGQLIDYYQPIIDLNTGRTHKAELLLRWGHPTRGFVSPAEFIPIAEDSGLIVEIGEWVLEQAIVRVKDWQCIADPEFAIGVNMSPIQFKEHGKDQLDLPARLKDAGISGKRLVIEITEGLLLRKDPVVAIKLATLAEAGIQLSIDDFGTGYSSLSYLSKFDIDYLKIDQSFVSGLEQGNETYAVCEAIIVMAHKLGIKTIAEGVESPKQRDILKQMGCDFAQGYLYSKPVPAEEFQELLLKEHREGEERK